MTGADRAPERSNVDDHLMRVAFPAAPHYDVPAGCKHARCRAGRFRRSRCAERAYTLFAHQPGHLWRHTLGGICEISATEHCGCDSKHAAWVALGALHERQ
jgi:hypothetical protein